MKFRAFLGAMFFWYKPRVPIGHYWVKAPPRDTGMFGCLYRANVCFCVFFFNLIPNTGEMFQFDEHIFQMGGSTTN